MRKVIKGRKLTMLIMSVLFFAVLAVYGIRSNASDSFSTDSGNKVIIYYRGFTTPYIHYQVEGGSWTDVPGYAMEVSNELEGYTHKYCINLGNSNSAQVCFNDGNGNWDSKYGQNYTFESGTYSYEMNNIVRLGDSNYVIGGKSEEESNNYEDIKSNLVSLYTENKEELVSKIKEMRNLGVKDSAITLRYGSCGPTSIAFQRILLDNGIASETRVDSKMYSGHEYNLYRVRLSDNSVKFIIIDGAYRQFMRSYAKKYMFENMDPDDVTDDMIDDALLASNLPEVLIYEYGNKDEAKGIIADALGMTVNSLPTEAYKWMDSAYESQTYPEPELQEIHTRYLSNDDVNTLNTGISYDKPYEGTLYLRGSWSNWEGRTAFEYVGNGVYEASIDLSTSNNGGVYEFKIDGNDWNNYVYGAGNSDTIQPVYDFYYNHYTAQSFLTDANNSPNVKMKITEDRNYKIRIDTRAGVSTPLVRVINN